jgi:hypothetical protein
VVTRQYGFLPSIVVGDVGSALTGWSTSLTENQRFPSPSTRRNQSERKPTRTSPGCGAPPPPPRSPLKSRDPNSIALSLRSLSLSLALALSVALSCSRTLCRSLWLSLALARSLSFLGCIFCETLRCSWNSSCDLSFSALLLFSLAPKIVYQYAVLKLWFLLLLLPIIVVPTLSVSNACRGYRRSSGYVDSQVSNWVHIYKTCPLVAILLSSQVSSSWENFCRRPVFSEPSS